MGRTIRKPKKSAIHDRELQVVVDTFADYNERYTVRFGKVASQEGRSSNSRVPVGSPFVQLGHDSGDDIRRDGTQLRSMSPQHAMAVALSIIEAVDELMPMCKECNGNGSIMYDEAPAGEHTTREEKCDTCKGEGRVLA